MMNEKWGECNVVERKNEKKSLYLKPYPQQEFWSLQQEQQQQQE
jgi:hypothetical protein